LKGSAIVASRGSNPCEDAAFKADYDECLACAGPDEFNIWYVYMRVGSEVTLLIGAGDIMEQLFQLLEKNADTKLHQKVLTGEKKSPLLHQGLLLLLPHRASNPLRSRLQLLLQQPVLM
jgi:hypothetical protein